MALETGAPKDGSGVPLCFTCHHDLHEAKQRAIAAL